MKEVLVEDQHNPSKRICTQLRERILMEYAKTSIKHPKKRVAKLSCFGGSNGGGRGFGNLKIL